MHLLNLLFVTAVGMSLFLGTTAFTPVSSLRQAQNSTSCDYQPRIKKKAQKELEPTRKVKTRGGKDRSPLPEEHEVLSRSADRGRGYWIYSWQLLCLAANDQLRTSAQCRCLTARGWGGMGGGISSRAK